MRVTLRELDEKAQLLKRQELDKIEEEEFRLKNETQEINDLIVDLTGRKEKLLKDLESKKNTNEKRIKDQISDLQDKIKSGKDNINENFSQLIKTLEEQRNYILKEKGVDTSRSVN